MDFHSILSLFLSLLHQPTLKHFKAPSPAHHHYISPNLFPVNLSQLMCFPFPLPFAADYIDLDIQRWRRNEWKMTQIDVKSLRFSEYNQSNYYIYFISMYIHSTIAHTHTYTHSWMNTNRNYEKKKNDGNFFQIEWFIKFSCGRDSGLDVVPLIGDWGDGILSLTPLLSALLGVCFPFALYTIIWNESSIINAI